LKVLIVDDFKPFGLVVYSTLQQICGFQVIDEASDGLEPVEKAEKLQPDLVVLALCGERAGRLWAEGKTDAAIRLEQLCDDLATTHDVDILCSYPIRSSAEQDEQSFNSICESHSVVSYR
jgi:DNA-binding NarL/FixJ family response regulator